MQEIAPGLFFIPGKNKARFPYSNSLYVPDRQRGLVDTGAGAENLSPLAREGVDLLINTHYHTDHTAQNRLFPGATIYAHTLDAEAIRSQAVFSAYTGLAFHPKFRESRVDKEFVGGDRFNFGQVEMEVMHLPGHTPGHSGFWFPQVGLLYSTDIDLTPFGPWYANLRSDLDAYEASAERIIALRPRIIVTGHAGPFRDCLEERLRDFMAKLAAREEALLRVLQKPRRLDELMGQGIIYRGFPAPEHIYRQMERLMLTKHLERFLARGQVIEIDGRFRARG